MFENESKVLLILSQDVMDRARVVAGKATTKLKLPVSLQIVLRALIEEGLKREGDPHFRANIETQAQAVRRIRTFARKGGRAAVQDAGSPPGRRRAPTGSQPERRGKSGRASPRMRGGA